ncbi:hypothetical protein [Williamsia sp. M5A3_1d]
MPDAWNLSTREFRLLWEEFDASDYPLEFAYTGTDDIHRGSDGPSAPSIRAERLTTPQREAMTALCKPSITIGVGGLDARKPFTDTSHQSRLVSATRDTEHVYIARQKLGDSPSIGATVSITRHALKTWTRDLVGLLPAAASAGSLPSDTNVGFGRLPGADTSTVATVVAPQHPSAASAFTNPQPATCGSIRVQVGSITDELRPLSMELRYRDIPGDGRYLLIIDSPGAALPIDDTSFAKTLNRVINTLRNRHNQRART